MTDSDSEVVREDRVLEGQVIMPFYLIADVSGSMRQDERELNEALADLIRAIMKDPVVDDLVMLSVITFNHAAQTVVPLSSPSEITPPVLRPSGGTSYEAAFREYDRAFAQDRAALKARGNQVYRPCVFFLTDGAPADRATYLETFRSLFAYDPESGTGNRAFPYFVPFGFRDASAHVISTLAYPDFGTTKSRWYLSASSNVGEVLHTIADVLGRSVVGSGLSASAGRPMIVPPEPPAGSGVQFGDAGDIVD
jgi:von Willebrand factor type A domain